MNPENFARSTGRSWEQWLAFLEGVGAERLSHREIARKVQESGDASGWWSQSIAVAYERHIGRRVVGQTSASTFAVSVTRTVPGELDAVFDAWKRFMAGREEYDGVAQQRPARTSATEKRRHWRAALADGSRVVVGIEQKAPDRVLFALAHEKLGSTDAIERWRGYWKSLLAEFR